MFATVLVFRLAFRRPARGPSGAFHWVRRLPLGAQKSVAGNPGHALAKPRSTREAYSAPASGSDTALELPLMPLKRTLPGFWAPWMRASTVGQL